MLWPAGHTYDPPNWDNLAQLLNAGYDAVKACSPETQVMLHIAEGGDNDVARWWFDSITRRDVPFDVIGISYYPYRHGSLAELQYNLNDISARYDKDVIVAETAYAFTDQDNDNYPNIVDQKLEFIQFHPTVLFAPSAPQFLLSEAMKGEGAILRNIRKEPFMKSYHPDVELAPRDIFSRAIISQMVRTKSPHVYLDLTHLSPEFVKRRFPRIYATCLHYAVDITKELVPVSPAAHYIMGGIKTDVNGATNIKGLFAAGEVTCTGVHGASRLASNSLLEGLVFGARTGRAAAEYGIKRRDAEVRDAGSLRPRGSVIKKSKDFPRSTETLAQQIAEQVVIAVPRPFVIEGDDDQGSAFELFQNLLPGCEGVKQDRVTKWTAHAVKDGGTQQESLNLF